MIKSNERKLLEKNKKTEEDLQGSHGEREPTYKVTRHGPRPRTADTLQRKGLAADRRLVPHSFQYHHHHHLRSFAPSFHIPPSPSQSAPRNQPTADKKRPPEETKAKNETERKLPNGIPNRELRNRRQKNSQSGDRFAGTPPPSIPTQKGEAKGLSTLSRVFRVCLRARA